MIEKQVPKKKLLLTGNNKRLILYIIKYLIVSMKTDINRKRHMFLQRVTCNKTHTAFVRTATRVLGGDYMIPVGRDEILSRFAGILSAL